jgi:hypothetical protein
MHLDPDISHYKVISIVSDIQKMKLQSVGYRVDIISDLADTARERLEEVSRINRFSRIHDMGQI